MDRRKDGQMDGQKDEQMDGWMDGQTDGRTDRQMDRWMNGLIILGLLYECSMLFSYNGNFIIYKKWFIMSGLMSLFVVLSKL